MATKNGDILSGFQDSGTLALRLWRDFRRKVHNDALLGGVMHDTAQWPILIEVFCAQLSGKPIKASDICDTTGLSMATTLRHLAKLERLNAITRRRCSQDTRRIFIELKTQWGDAIRAVLASC
ncbi:MAG: ArsR family transcriptional regulator [Pseudomonadota bacterium]